MIFMLVTHLMLACPGPADENEKNAAGGEHENSGKKNYQVSVFPHLCTSRMRVDRLCGYYRSKRTSDRLQSGIRDHLGSHWGSTLLSLLTEICVKCACPWQWLPKPTSLLHANTHILCFWETFHSPYFTSLHFTDILQPVLLSISGLQDNSSWLFISTLTAGSIQLHHCHSDILSFHLIHRLV